MRSKERNDPRDKPSGTKSLGLAGWIVGILAKPPGSTARYSWSDARHDLIAGLTVAAIAVPQAMAYALIAGIDPIYGLYSAIVVTAVASVFGSSSHLINGPTNAISLVTFSALAFVAAKPEDAFEATFLLAVMAGGIQILVAVFRLGDLTRYISESVVIGFMAGAGFLIALTQVGNLLGLKDQGTGHQHVLLRFWKTLTEGGTVNWRALAIGLVTALLIILLRKVTRKFHLPRFDMLLALGIAGIAAATLGWSQAAGNGHSAIAVVGEIRAAASMNNWGWPGFHVPQFPLAWIRELSGSSLAVACLGLLEALSIAKAISHQTRQPLDYNRQCLAEGLGNLCGGFFQCLPGSGSLTRSAINFQAGAVTRFSGVFAAGAVALVVCLFGPLAKFIPKASLAGILLVTAAGLIDHKRIGHAVRASRFDALLVLATALSAVLIGVEFSILIGVGLSIVMFVPRAARLQASELTVGADRVIRDRLPTDTCCTRMVLLDLEGEFFFGAEPELDRYFDGLRERADLRVIVLRVKRTRNPDIVCMESLHHFILEMQAKGVTVMLCGVRTDFHQTMQNLRFQDFLPADRVFLEDSARLGSATLAAVRHAYDLLGNDLCEHCPRRTPPEPANGTFYYQI
jgi:sulfate permease, SulP family